MRFAVVSFCVKDGDGGPGGKGCGENVERQWLRQDKSGIL